MDAVILAENLIPGIVERPEITIDGGEAADYEFVMEQLGKRKVE